MKIYDKSYYYGLGVIALMSGVCAMMFNQHDNSLKKNHAKRLQDMEYVERNAPQKYINTLEILNKTKSPRITPENINDLWTQAATEVKDSLELTKNK